MGKYSKELGIDAGTAHNRLVKDLLWKFIVQCETTKCFRCGLEMCRETYSVEHKIPWRGTDNARGLFFDLDNVTFSHLKCNMAAARKPTKLTEIPHGTISGYNHHNCRCDLCKIASRDKRRRSRKKKLEQNIFHCKAMQ